MACTYLARHELESVIIFIIIVVVVIISISISVSISISISVIITVVIIVMINYSMASYPAVWMCFAMCAIIAGGPLAEQAAL